MNRRTLFRTLAGALCAPLVKWLPKDERHPLLDRGVIYVPGNGIKILPITGDTRFSQKNYTFTMTAPPEEA